MFNAALYVGERSRQYFEHYSYPKDRLFFAPHGVDEALFGMAADTESGQGIRSELGIAERDPIFLFVGKLIRRKRVHDLFAAAKICEESGQRAHVVIAGSGPLETNFVVSHLSSEFEPISLDFKTKAEFRPSMLRLLSWFCPRMMKVGVLLPTKR